MSFTPGKDWSRESDDLFIHKSGARVAKTTYHQKLGWFLMPPDLDQTVVEFPPTDEGRDQAFEAFAKGAVSKVPKKAKPAAKKGAPPPAEEEEREEPADAEAVPGAAEEEVDEDEDEEEEEEETAEPG